MNKEKFTSCVYDKGYGRDLIVAILSIFGYKKKKVIPSFFATHVSNGFLKNIILVLFLLSMSGLSAQKMDLEMQVDTIKNEFTTFVSLIDIPQGGRVRFQMRLPDKVTIIRTHFENCLWDTNDDILTVISLQYPLTDTLVLSFVSHLDSLPDTILWGEAALMFENGGKVEKLNLNGKYHQLKNEMNPLSVVEEHFYVQISASTTRQSINLLKQQFKLQQGDVIIESKKGNFYRYLVGTFTSKEAAKEKMKYYRKTASDAFVVAE